MEILRPAEQALTEVIERSRELLLSGKIIAYPTETFYGIGARYDSEKALDMIYTIKRRPREKAMPLIIGSRDLLSMVAAEVPVVAERLMERFWPGPLTLVFRAKQGLSEYITAGSGKVAVRMPGKSFALDLAVSLNFPVTATSANISGMPPASDLATVISYFPDGLDAAVDFGSTAGKLPSTLVDITGREILILRKGMISEEDILAGITEYN